MNAPVANAVGGVQRLVVKAENRLKVSRCFVVRISRPERARAFIGSLVARGLVRSAEEREGSGTAAGQPESLVTIGFTFEGLEMLELATGFLRVFQEKAGAFAGGAFVRAPARLGDMGASAPAGWEESFRPGYAHIVLVLHATDRHALDQAEKHLWANGAMHPLKEWGSEEHTDGERLFDERGQTIVHFDLVDSISNPGIQGFHQSREGYEQFKRGEFILGYENEKEYNPWLLVNPSSTPDPWLPPLNRAPDLAEFFRDGSFLAYRKIGQDVARFDDTLRRWAQQLGGHRDVEAWTDYLKAKLTGRWSNGRVVAPHDAEPPARPGLDPSPPKSRINKFDFCEDPEGLGCPFGAHIRRMNPREGPVLPFRKRPLIRRGMPYGPRYEQGERPTDRGLLGLFFCASLEDQFEFLLGQWSNQSPMGPPDRGDSKDPLIGRHESPQAVFDIPMTGEKLRMIGGFAPFVQTRGTLYAFVPSLHALRRIALRGERV